MSTLVFSQLSLHSAPDSLLCLFLADHMSAMKMIDDIHAAGGHVRSFVSSCGGLPAAAAADNPLGYKFSWNPRGAILAGRNAATYKMDGQVVNVAGGSSLFVLSPYAEAISPPVSRWVRARRQARRGQPLPIVCPSEPRLVYPEKEEGRLEVRLLHAAPRHNCCTLIGWTRSSLFPRGMRSERSCVREGGQENA